jgi:integrase
MPSLQARHARSCDLGRPWTPAQLQKDGSDPLDGCTCKPLFHVVVREGPKKTHRQRVGRDRREAERALNKVEVTVDEGDWRPHLNIRFNDWADKWEASLETKETTARGYKDTAAYAKKVFGHKIVRRLTAADIAEFNAFLREKPITASTRAKHLRVLGACLQAAIPAGYAASNPVRELPRQQRPKPEKRESAYFLNDELPKLFNELHDELHKTLCLVALKTGMRQGELVALRWRDVDLTERVIRVRATYTMGVLSTPKNHERRDVDITSDVVDLLGAWWGECGSPPDDMLVFPGNGTHGYLVDTTIRRVLYDAMEDAGVERLGPTGTKRTWHSLRHSFAKRALESGAQVTWLQRHLGHSSLEVTNGRYGHWERAERRRQAEIMEGVFGV